MGHVAEGVVGPRCGVDHRVDVLAPLFLASAREHEVRVDHHVGGELVLHADRRHMAIRRVMRPERHFRSVRDRARITVR